MVLVESLRPYTWECDALGRDGVAEEGGILGFGALKNVRGCLGREVQAMGEGSLSLLSLSSLSLSSVEEEEKG